MVEFVKRSRAQFIQFSVACVPVPQPRQRHRVIRSGPKAYATNYTPARHPVQAFKQLVALAARQAWKGRPREGALTVRVRFRMPVPGLMAAPIRRHVGAGGESPHIVKPDIDNLLKAIFDALTGICWADDKQISRIEASKVYAREAGVDVWVGEWGGEDGLK